MDKLLYKWYLKNTTKKKQSWTFFKNGENGASLGTFFHFKNISACSCKWLSGAAIGSSTSHRLTASPSSWASQHHSDVQRQKKNMSPIIIFPNSLIFVHSYTKKDKQRAKRFSQVVLVIFSPRAPCKPLEMHPLYASADESWPSVAPESL